MKIYIFSATLNTLPRFPPNFEVMGQKKTTQAMLRAQLIMKVRCRLMTATEAAEHLGVSRKTWYKWEQWGLAALLNGLSDQQAGRPEKPGDPGKAALVISIDFYDFIIYHFLSFLISQPFQRNTHGSD